MRKTSVRKFIHMVIDILPLLIIPIFALNILHKETEPISIEVQENKEVYFNQMLGNSLTNTDEYRVYSENSLTLKPYNYTNTTYMYFDANLYGIQYEQNHKYLFSLNSNYSQIVIMAYNNSIGVIGSTYMQAISTSNHTARVSTFIQINPFNLQNEITIYPQIFDLTLMFGEGNEPSITEFNSMFPDIPYSFALNKKVLVPDVTTTYNSTDIGSQFVYALYKPVHDYFNFNNLFNMGAIYNWIELNLFSGTAPLPIFIIWNVIVYEFFVDLIFLLYGVFMFIIDFAEKCLERPFRR